LNKLSIDNEIEDDMNNIFEMKDIRLIMNQMNQIIN